MHISKSDRGDLVSRRLWTVDRDANAPKTTISIARGCVKFFGYRRKQSAKEYASLLARRVACQSKCATLRLSQASTSSHPVDLVCSKVQSRSIDLQSLSSGNPSSFSASSCCPASRPSIRTHLIRPIPPCYAPFGSRSTTPRPHQWRSRHNALPGRLGQPVPRSCRRVQDSENIGTHRQATSSNGRTGGLSGQLNRALDSSW